MLLDEIFSVLMSLASKHRPAHAVHVGGGYYVRSALFLLLPLSHFYAGIYLQDIYWCYFFLIFFFFLTNRHVRGVTYQSDVPVVGDLFS